MNSVHRRLDRFLKLQPYQGSTTDLVIGIDVGTTFSGVSYAILQPDIIPEVRAVEKFTDQTTTDAKIPSVMYFDKDMNLQAAGASAVSNTTVNTADFEKWTKVEYFKMHLRPSHMHINTIGLALGTLPQGMTAVEAMGHFLRYLYRETLEYIEEHEIFDTNVIKSFEDRISFVLSHPNGWEGPQQQRMREAAILGGLINDDTAGHARLKFVTEGEASALACLANGLCPPNLKPGYRFMIADCGGATLDITSYEITQTSPLKLREMTGSDCCFAGGVFVNREMHKLLEVKLRGSHYDNPDELNELVDERFETSLKREFKDEGKTMWMLIGSRSEVDSQLGIKRGSLKIEGFELEKCFQFSVNSLIEAIENQIEECNIDPIPVWLVGGFANSPWLLAKASNALNKQGTYISRPDTFLAKAVANGNVLFVLDSTVTKRVTKRTYGTLCNQRYDPLNPEHVRRSHLCYEALDGKTQIPSYFDIIVEKGIEVEESEKHTHSYTWNAQNSARAVYTDSLICFRGSSPAPKWYDENQDLFQNTCTIKADLSKLFRPEWMCTYKNNRFWRIKFDIEVSFGQTALQARIKWIENGIEKYGPASIFFDE